MNAYLELCGDSNEDVYHYTVLFIYCFVEHFSLEFLLVNVDSPEVNFWESWKRFGPDAFPAA